ncbi:MAG: hypothetical protein RLZZ416_115 [Candidatus Parcubacteria bacterium]
MKPEVHLDLQGDITAFTRECEEVADRWRRIAQQGIQAWLNGVAIMTTLALASLTKR